MNIDASESGTLWSVLEGLHNFDQNNDGILDQNDHNGCIAIRGRLVIDQDLTIRNCTDLRMQPCSEIVVNAQSHLTMTQNTIYGCEQMWQGIRVAPFGRLTFQFNEIRDAEHAVWAEGSGFLWPTPPGGVGNTTISVQNNRFIRNHIGVRISGASGSSNISHIPFRRNTFNGVDGGQLLPPCTQGLPNWEQASGYAGLVVQNTDFVAGVGGDATALNTFASLRNGAIAENCGFQMHNGDFSDIIGEWTIIPGVPLPSFNLSRGIGVLSLNGTATVSNSDITGADRGIYSINGRLTATGNSMATVNYGITAHQAYRFDILENQDIFYAVRGIVGRSLNVIPFFDFSSYNIHYNHLRNSSSIEVGTAIDMLSANTPTLIKARMHANDIRFANGDQGIFVGNQGGWVMDDNAVLYQDLTNVVFKSGLGIVLTNSRSNRLYENTVLDLTPAPATTAYRGNIAPSNLYCCNNSEGTKTGFEFLSACAATELKTGAMFAHTNAIRLANNTTIGEQGPNVVGTLNFQNYGNLFNVTSGTAVNETNNPNGVFGNRFHVLSDQTPDLPEMISIPNLPNPPDWFETDGSGDFTCTDCGSPTAPADGRDGLLDQADRITAGTGYGNATAGERTLQWENARHLYARMRENPTLHNQDVVVDSFYTAAAGGALHDYFVADSLANAVSVVSDSVATGMVAAMQQADSIDLLANQSLAALSGAVTWSDSLAVYVAADSIRLSGADAQAAFQQAIAAAVAERKLKAQDALSYVSGLSAATLLEKNRKDALHLFLKSLAQDSFDLSESERDSLSALAHQCPEVGGSAVYLARALFVQLIAEKGFADDSLCASTEREAKRHLPDAEETPNDMQLVPNPASGVVWVFGLPTDGSRRTIRLFNAAGQQVARQAVPGEATTHPFDVTQLPAGVYHCRVSSENGMRVSKRLMIMH
ncbi:MAG: T9SS type A sorting domain-containing protein [Saprospiraceae bacterium]|nr:T9SS type A sorting domain-containing protein [Saprospiraceae bacterium]